MKALRLECRRVAQSIGVIVGAGVLLLPSCLIAQQNGVLNVAKTITIDGEKALLMPVGEVVIGPGGTIAIVQPLVRSVRLFDSGGAAVITLGRNGDGPGEFRSISRIGWSGDTLWVIDSQLKRVTFFSRDGDVFRTEGAPMQAQPLAGKVDRFPEFRSASAVARLPDGSFIVYAHLTAGGPTSPLWGRTAMTYLRTAADGSILHLVASVPDITNHEQYAYYHTFADGSRKGRPFPFAAPPEYEVSADGMYSVVRAVGGRDPATAFVRLTMIRSDGDTTYSKAYLVPAIALPRNVADSAIAATVSSMRDARGMRPSSWTDGALRSAAAAWQERAEDHVPPFFPPVPQNSPTVIGRDGSVWIPLRETAEGRPYLVLDAEGNAIGQPVFPASVRIAAADATVAWGVELDENDVPSLVRYRLSLQNR